MATYFELLALLGLVVTASRAADAAAATDPDGQRFPDGTPAIAFAVNNFAGFDQIIRHPVSDITAFTVVGPQAANFTGMDFDPLASTLWALDPVASRIGTVNQDTGAFTNGPLLPVRNYSGLAIDPIDGAFYVVAPGTNGSDIYLVDTSTGATSLIASVVGTAFSAIAIDCAGRFYGYDSNAAANALYTINLVSGTGTPVGPTNAVAAITSMDFDNSTGALIAWLYAGAGNVAYGTINTTTGAFGLVATAAGRYEGAVRNACTPPLPLIFANGFES